LLVEADLPKRDGIPGEAEAILRLGGEGRQVLLRRLDRAIAWPRMVPDAGRRSVVLTTPGLFASGWKPAGLKPLAAAVPSPLAVSGWDLARGGPKPTRFAVPAGAVYFVNDPLAQPYSGSLADGEDAAIGWGCYLEGTWNHV
jgi:CRISPR-associated protein Cmr3